MKTIIHVHNSEFALIFRKADWIESGDENWVDFCTHYSMEEFSDLVRKNPTQYQIIYFNNGIQVPTCCDQYGPKDWSIEEAREMGIDVDNIINQVEGL